MALAMEMPYVPPSQRFALAGGFGVFRDKAAFSGAAGFRIDDNVQFNAGLGIGINHGSVGGRVGVTIGW